MLKYKPFEAKNKGILCSPRMSQVTGQPRLLHKHKANICVYLHMHYIANEVGICTCVCKKRMLAQASATLSDGHFGRFHAPGPRTQGSVVQVWGLGG